MADKKIKFSAENDVSPVIAKLKRDSEELGRGLIRDARAYTTSGKEALAYIEEQIKAIERRTRVAKQGQLVDLEAKKQREGISPSAYKRQVSEINLASKEDTQQVALLRELIETTKQTSKREIVEDRKGVEKQLIKSKTVGELGPRGDELKILKETLQRQQLGDVKSQEREERDNLTGGVAEKAAGVAGMVGGSQNQFFAIASALAFIPVIGQAASTIASRALGAAQTYQTAAGGMYGLAGQGSYFGRGSGMQSIGLTKAEVLQLNKQVAISRGGVAGSYGATKDLAYLEKGAGLDRGMLLEQEKLTRGGGTGALAGTQRLTRGLQAIGAMDQDTSLLGEYLPLLINIQQEQLKVAGETNNEIATNLVAGIASLDESFKNPDVLRGVLPALMQGFKAPSSPQMEALQFRALSAANPNASLLDLEEMRENPTLKGIGGYLNQLRSVSANKEVFARNIRGSFAGLSTSQARKIAGGFGEDGFDLGDYSGQLGITNLKGRAIGATGTLDAASANFTQMFETGGQALTNAIDKFIDQQLPASMDDLKESVDVLAKIMGGYQAVVKTESNVVSKGATSFGVKAAKLIKSVME